MSDTIPWKQTMIVTLACINLMMIALIIGFHTISFESSVPSAGKPAHPQLQTEYSMEKIGSHRLPRQPGVSGYWLVEHYQEYEYHYNEQGKLIDKRPTPKKEHMRYWITNKN